MRGGLIGPGTPEARRITGTGRPVLALHGFGGTPREVDALVDVAAALGRPAHAPLLPGHGTTVAELAATRFEDWLAAAERALGELPAHPGGAVVLGLSMGSLLATELTARHPGRVHACGFLANALWLGHPFPTLALQAWERLGLGDRWLPKVGADLADPAARRSHLTYDAQPILGAVSVLRAGERARRLLPSIRVPALVLHGARDRVCPPANAPRAAALLGSSEVTLQLFPRSRHIITRDLERDQVAAAVRAFLTKVG